MYYNLDSHTLSEISIERGECTKAASGALLTTTGKYKGRAPDAKFYVRDETTEDLIDWSNNKSLTEEEFDKELKEFLKYKEGVHPLFCQDVRAVRDKRYSVNIRVYTEYAKHSLFTRNMFVPSSPNGDVTDIEYKVYHFPKKEDEAKVIISLKEKIVLITGTHYSGEIKKSVFSILNFVFPHAGLLSMHCSINVDKSRENPAIFFGLSGTGKTTLSSDENRILIGDDEHGWTSDGLTNFEGGCYAKTISLSKEAEPQIWEACNKPLAILENVVAHDGVPDFDDGTITENTRASYPCSSIPDADRLGFVDSHPKNIVMLTCDAFGVLPAVMKLDHREAVQQFLLGYTAKVAGTEAGVKEPKATFSFCFGAPFMPLRPHVYADLLEEMILKHQTSCWLVNTGWSGGPYGEGSRMPIKVTRSIIDKILDGSLEKCETTFHSPTGFTVPLHDSIPQKYLIPELSWADAERYQQKSQELIDLFDDNKKGFTT